MARVGLELDVDQKHSRKLIHKRGMGQCTGEDTRGRVPSFPSYRGVVLSEDADDGGDRELHLLRQSILETVLQNNGQWLFWRRCFGTSSSVLDVSPRTGSNRLGLITPYRLTVDMMWCPEGLNICRVNLRGGHLLAHWCKGGEGTLSWEAE